MFFQLHEHCKLVRGACRGAIYDLQSGKVHSLNRGACELLTACSGTALEQLLDVTAPENQAYVKFLQRLVELGLGSFYFLAPSPRCAAPAEPAAPGLEFLWLELTSRCNNRCLHCYATSGPERKVDAVPRERWLALVAEARALGATAIQLIGGEPLLVPFWREIVAAAQAQGYEFIEIFTNATLLTDDDIAFCRQYGVNIATTVYAGSAPIHDMVTQNPGSFDRTLAAIKKVQAAGLGLRIASIIMKVNEHEVENIRKLNISLGLEPQPPDVVRPTGRGDDAALRPTAYVKPPITPPFFTDRDTFYHAQRWHTCLAGKLAVTSDGDVIPCIFARGQVCGNVLRQPLAEILNGQQLQRYWRTTKDQVEKCCDCEYRYACMDCRPLAQGSDQARRWLACATGCPYNPYTGIWEVDNQCQITTIAPSGKNPTST